MSKSSGFPLFTNIWLKRYASGSAIKSAAIFIIWRDLFALRTSPIVNDRKLNVECWDREEVRLLSTGTGSNGLPEKPEDVKFLLKQFKILQLPWTTIESYTMKFGKRFTDKDLLAFQNCFGSVKLFVVIDNYLAFLIKKEC